MRRATVLIAGSIAAVAVLGAGCAAATPAPDSSSAAPAARRITPTGSASHHVRRHPVTTQPTTRLPLDEPTHAATQVITVVAPSRHSTTARLQRWAKRAGAWHAVGPAVAANLGTDGLSLHASESRSATPIGSFTLTRAFGHDADPGTRLPYTRTTPDDWWVSEPGPLYNTRQRCSARCGFRQGDPNEHLYYETPAYDYAVVIDYNTRNAPGGVRQGRGSAFFLHVSEGVPTAGCVSIPVGRLLHVLRWLNPADRPRILVGTG